MLQTNTSFTKDQHDAVTKSAKAKGISMAEFIRQACVEKLQREAQQLQTENNHASVKEGGILQKISNLFSPSNT